MNPSLLLASVVTQVTSIRTQQEKDLSKYREATHWMRRWLVFKNVNKTKSPFGLTHIHSIASVFVISTVKICSVCLNYQKVSERH